MDKVVSVDKFPELSLIVPSSVEPKELDSSELLLNWVNYQLKSAGSDLCAEDFSSDFKVAIAGSRMLVTPLIGWPYSFHSSSST